MNFLAGDQLPLLPQQTGGDHGRRSGVVRNFCYGHHTHRQFQFELRNRTRNHHNGLHVPDLIGVLRRV